MTPGALEVVDKISQLLVYSNSGSGYNGSIKSSKDCKMNWNKQGEKITAMYQGQRVSGTVESSRVKYGAGKVQHLLILDQPIQVRWRTEPTDRLLINEDEMVDIV